MLPDDRSNYERLSRNGRYYATAIYVLMLPIFVGSVFGFPCPFVRHVWMGETLGLSGLINGLLLALVAHRTGKMSLSAPFGGLGLILNEMVLASRGFLYLMKTGKATYSAQFFFALTLLVCVIGFIFFAGLIYNHAKYHSIRSARKPATEKKEEAREYLPLAVSIGVYAALSAIIFLIFALGIPEPWASSVLKIITVLASFLSFEGIGREIKEYLVKHQSKTKCSLKAATHALALVAIFRIVYRLMPIRAMIR